MKINSMISSVDFVKEIEDLARERKIEYIDAVVTYCEKNNIEIETAAAIIKSSSLIKSKIQAEAESLNILVKAARLPIDD